MPFLGQDWRSPGEQWVRTDEGWQRLDLWRLKLLESLFEHVLERLQLKLARGEHGYYLLHKELKPSQPYVLVKEVTKEVKGYIQLEHSGRKTREVMLQIEQNDFRDLPVATKPDHNVQGKQKMRTTIAEALSRLDVSGAVRDIKRFNYVSKLMMFLIQNKMSSLSGMAQKIVIDALDQVVQQAMKTHHNLRIVHQLLDEMLLALDRGNYDHVGSASLWDSHKTRTLKFKDELSAVTIEERDDDGKMTLSDLPDTVIHDILACLSDHQDLVNAGRTELRAFELSEQKRLWRNLCQFHFTPKQWSSVLRRGENLETIEWKMLYARLMKRYGLKDVYAEMVHICRHCNALFWELHGHPCPVQNMEPESMPVSPKVFVDFFSA